MSPVASPLVSIVTVNFNGSEDTIEMIDSLTRITYANIEIIVVDNHSENDNPRIIKERFPSIVLYESNVNMGFDERQLAKCWFSAYRLRERKIEVLL